MRGLRIQALHVAPLLGVVWLALPACSGDSGDGEGDEGLYGEGGSPAAGGAGSGLAPGFGGTTAATGGLTGTGATAAGGSSSGGATVTTGGSVGVGGANSMGGVPDNPMCPEQTADRTNPLIDDLEDGDDSVPQVGDRIGFWYTFNDGSPDGTQLPPTGQGNFEPTGGVGSGSGANGTDFAARTWGEGFVGDPAEPPAVGMPGFARLVMTLRQVAGEYCAYDARAYSGISFWAKGNVELRFRVPSTMTMPLNQGGTGICQPGCYDHHSATIQLTDEWQLFTFAWSDLRQSGFAVPAARGPLDPATLIELHWEAYDDDAVGPFDFSIDEVTFTTG